jgi:hypothetical protein
MFEPAQASPSSCLASSMAFAIASPPTIGLCQAVSQAIHASATCGAHAGYVEGRGEEDWRPQINQLKRLGIAGPMTKIVCLENPYWEPWQQEAALEGQDTEPMQGARFVAPEPRRPEPSEG